MPSANYTMGNGGYNLTTDIGGGGMGMGTNPDLEFFREMAQRKAMQSDADRARRIRLEDEAMGRALAPQMGGGPGGIDSQLDMSNKRTQIIKNNAATQNPMLDPFINIGNTGNAYQHNANNMNAFQRELYLPGGSSMGGDINANSYDQRAAANERNSRPAAPGLDTRADFYGLGSYGQYSPVDDRQRRR